MRKFVIEVLDTAEQITPEKAFDILTFAFRGEVLSVQESGPTPAAPDDVSAPCKKHGFNFCVECYPVILMTPHRR
jgi:hypothetical protein